MDYELISAKRMRINLKIAIVATLCALFPVACKDKTGTQSNSEYFKIKFAKAFEYYKRPEDSLKLRALNFILDNLDEQYYYSSANLETYKNILLDGQQRSVSRVQAIYDSLSKKSKQPKLKVIRDRDQITSEYLIDNIDQAFKAWNKPWSKEITFDEFCNYILPYKSADEQPGLWRKDLAKYYERVIDSSGKNVNPIIAVNQINRELATWYTVSLTYNFPTDIGFDIARVVKTGSCDNSSKMALYAMRGMGLPVALDYVPQWANRSGNHSWNALVYKKNVYTFNAAEGSIGSHKVEFIGVGRMKYKRAKVFRRTFAKNPQSLYFINNGEEDIPKMFQNTKYRDVTDQYIPTSNIVVKAEGDKRRFGYLCVFDNEGWFPVQWGEIKSNKILFPMMGRDVLYLPTIYSQGDVVSIADPLILQKDGEIKTLNADVNRKVRLSLKKKYPDDESNNIKVGDEYELFYWKNEWISLGGKVAKDTVLIFDAAPSNALFWLRDLTEGTQERIFTYEKGQQIWW
jgi:hypothetical protein